MEKQLSFEEYKKKYINEENLLHYFRLFGSSERFTKINFDNYCRDEYSNYISLMKGKTKNDG